MPENIIRRACCDCHVPLDGLGAITTRGVSHGFCMTCGIRWHGDFWEGSDDARWTGDRLARARRLAQHGTRRTAKLLGIAPSTVRRSERRPRITRYVQRALCHATSTYAYYHGLTTAD
jgi:hypothetical protein